MALDIFGGAAVHSGYGSADAQTEEARAEFVGWDVGASVRPLPWLGITGAIGRTWQGETRIMHYLAGPRFTTSYGDNYYGVRGFAHVLVGVAAATAADLPTQTGMEIAVGAGFDIWGMVRFQFDYLRLPGNVRTPGGHALQQNQVRGVVGGVLPLCFRGCRPNELDGLDLSK